MGGVRETFWLIMFMANLSIKFCEFSVSRSLLKSHYGNGTGICESFPVSSTLFFFSIAFVCIGLGEKFANSRLRFSFVLQVVLLAEL